MASGKSGNIISSDDVLNDVVSGRFGEFSGLAKYFNVGTSDGLISDILNTSSDALDPLTAQANRDVLGVSSEVNDVVRRALLDVTKGAYTTRDLVRFLEDSLAGLEGDEREQARSDMLKVLTINSARDIATRGFGSEESINDMLSLDDSVINTSNNTKLTPGLSSILVHPIGLSFSTKNVAALSLFMNAIPSIEFTRAVPYVELSVRTGRPPVSSDGRLNSPSTLKFILGGADVSNSNVDLALASAAPVDDESSSDGTGLSIAGMELFTSPQLMSPLDTSDVVAGNVVRPTDVLDRFRPLVSLDGVSINVAPSTGFMSFKTATLTLTVYDRSRLHEIADFVKPDLFSRTEFTIEYGWHHPMSTDDPHEYTSNLWGALLNAMRVKERYGIVNSSFNMDDTGVVKIQVDLAMKGANEYRTTLVGSDVDVRRSAEYVDSLRERIAQLRDSLTSKIAGGSRGSKGVLGSQILDAASSTNGSPELDVKLRRRLDRTISRLNALGSDDASELAATLTELYGTRTSSEGSAVRRLKNSITAVINRKFRAIEDEDHGALIDPYFHESIVGLPDRDLKTVMKSASEYVSLGKVIMNFIGLPLAHTLRFDDVQVLFYTFNSSAGAMRNRSIAGFLIRKDELRREFDSFVMERRGAAISVGDFMNFITQTFLDNMASVSYGLSTIYKRDKEGRLVPNFRTGRKADRDARAAAAAERKLLAMGVPDGVFKMPQVDLHMETLPAKFPPGVERDVSGDELTILRIHVFDRAATAYETQQQLLAAARDSALGSVTFDVDVEKDDLGLQRLRAMTYIKTAQALNIIEPVPESDIVDEVGDTPIYAHYRLVGGPQAVRDFVRSTAPTITYGSQNTAVQSIGLQSMQNPLLSTVNMLRSDRAGSITPEGAGRGGVPLKTIPAELNVTTMGCPLLSFTQQFFVDVQTGTDLDNIYAITSLQHNIEPGSFKSSFQMTPLQGFGKYESTLNKTEAAINELAELTRGS